MNGQAAAIRARLLARLNHDLRGPLARIAARARGAVEALHAADAARAVHGADGEEGREGVTDTLVASAADPAQVLAAIESTARRQLEWLGDLQQCGRNACAPPELALAPTYLYALLRQVEQEGRALLREMEAAGEIDKAGEAGAVGEPRETGGSGEGDEGGERRGTALRCVVEDDVAAPALALLDARQLALVLRKLLEQAALCGAAPLMLSLRALPAENVASVAPAGEAGRAVALWFTVSAGQPAAAPAWRQVASSFEHGDEGARIDDIVPGLLLAAQLLQAMGAALERDAGLDTGRRWRFELVTVIANEDDALPPAPRFAAPPPFGRGHRVLLRERDGPMRDYLMEILESAECDVLEELEPGGDAPALALCADGASAWQLLLDLRRRHGAQAPPVLLHALRPPIRPEGFPPQLDFAEVLYRPAPPEALLAALRRQLGSPA